MPATCRPRECRPTAPQLDYPILSVPPGKPAPGRAIQPNIDEWIDASPTSLDPNRFNVEKPLSDTPEQDYRFQGCQQQREIWTRVLPEVEPTQSRLDRFARCGLHAWVFHSPSRQEYRIRANCCNLRICPICGVRLREETATRIQTAIGDVEPNAWKLVTLTMKHSNAPLRTQHANLRAAFRRLRQRKLWKVRVLRGFAVIETTYNATSGQWHPHLHVLAECAFIPQEELSKAWGQVTCGSFIVDVRQVREGGKAAEYIAGYIAKTPQLPDFEGADALYADYYKALDRSKLLITFGEHPDVDDAEPSDDEGDDWTAIAPLDELLASAGSGDSNALVILESLQGVTPHAHPHQPFDTP